MAAYDDIQRTFREFKRYTGDGLPGEPTGAALPIGDPQSGPHNPKKVELRETLGGFAQVVEATIPAIEAARDDAISDLHDEIDPLVDAAEAARDIAAGYASDAVSQGNVPIYATRAGLPGLAVPVGMTAIRLNGIFASDDARGGIYAYRETEPSHSSKAQDENGRWFEQITADIPVEFARGNIFFSPDLDYDPAINLTTPTVGNTTPPTIAGVQRYSNVFINPGATSYVRDRMWRNTVVGEGAFRIMEEAQRTNAIGNSALGFARFSDRNDAFGSLTMQWLGQNLSRDLLTYYTHDMFSSEGVLITNPAWNFEGLATRNPDIRAQLAAYADWATTPDDVGNNAAFGRNALLHLLKGKFNTAGGYRSSAHLINGQKNTSWGHAALQDNIFGSENVGIGSSAGEVNQDGSGNTYLGHGAGSGIIHGDSNVVLGRNAGVQSTLISAGGNVWLGRDAGRNLNVDTNDTLIIQNNVSRVPLLSGSFSPAPKIGINMPHTEIRGTFHVMSASFGASAGANSGADELVVENNGPSGISVRSPNNAVGSLLFADPEGSGHGGIQYSHALDRLSLRANNSDRMFITGTGMGFNGTAAIAKPTGVAVTAAAIHAALVSYGLIAA